MFVLQRFYCYYFCLPINLIVLLYTNCILLLHYITIPIHFTSLIKLILKFNVINYIDNYILLLTVNVNLFALYTAF